MTDDRPHPDLDAPLTSAEADEMRRVMNEGVTRARTFGQRLRELRRERGITLRAAAEKIGRDFTYLSKIENDRCLPPSAEVIVALADLLDSDAEELAILGDKPPIAVVRRQLMEAVSEVRRLRAVLNEAESLLDCTEFALEWLLMHHVIEDGGKDWRSKFDGSAFFACDCSENGGYMEYDTNAYIHTERCAAGFEDSLPALYDQIKALRPRARAALADGPSSGEARCPHGHAGCCGHHDLEDMPIHVSGDCR